MKKLLLLLFVSLILVSLVSAGINELPTQRQGKNVSLLQNCVNSSYSNVSSVILANGAILNISNYMTRYSNSFYNYTLMSGNTTSLGVYVVNGICDENGIAQTWQYTFEITPSGRSFSTANSIIYFALLFLLIIIFVGGAFAITQLPATNTRDEEGRMISISWLKYLRSGLWFVEYILFVAILFMASNLAYAFLSEELFASVLFALYQIAFRLAPVVLIIWIVWIFAKIFQDKQFWGMMKRGMFPQGKL